MTNIISGLNTLSRQLADAQSALEALDGELGSVSFDPNDPASIELAIQNVWLIIDEKVVPFADNPVVSPLVEGMKEQYREAIINRAAEARLIDGTESNVD
jgi:hypothetical protein